MGRDEMIKNDKSLLSWLERLDVVLVRFEKAWHDGEAPRIEMYLEEVEEPERSLLLRELMGLELELDSGTGRFPDLSDYLRRFAGDLRLIDQVFRDEERPRDSNTRDHSGVPTPSDDVARLCEGTETTEDPPHAKGGPSTRHTRMRFGESRRTRHLPRISRRMGRAGSGARWRLSRHQFTETHSLLKSTSGDKQFGRYRLLRVLGQGAFGRVHLAIRRRAQAASRDQGADSGSVPEPGDADRYLAEARIVATLDHPNIVPVYDLGRTGGWLGLCRLQVHCGPHARRAVSGAARG